MAVFHDVMRHGWRERVSAGKREAEAGLLLFTWTDAGSGSWWTVARADVVSGLALVLDDPTEVFVGDDGRAVTYISGDEVVVGIETGDAFRMTAEQARALLDALEA